MFTEKQKVFLFFSVQPLFARIINRLIKGMVQKALDKDMDAVKAYCEA